MPNTLQDILLANDSEIKKSGISSTYNTLHQLAFENAAQAIIITHPIANGNLLKTNRATCKLLGYAKKELLTKSRADIFEVHESSFKKMLKQRKAGGQSTALVTGIKKSGKLFPCEVTSAVFMNEDGKTFAITTIADMSENINRQKRIDTKKEKVVAENIVLAKLMQKVIDTQNEKIVADNIVLAKSMQKIIDTQNEKIVIDNIVLAKSKQKEIDTKNKKRVSHNIVLARSAQKKIDTRNKKTVADNIVLAKSAQKLIDAQNEKIVADNIVLAKSLQKIIDTQNEKTVADNIVLAKSMQKVIDAQNEKVVSDNIVLAKSKQKAIDIKNKKRVSRNIVIAKSAQKVIDAQNEKIVDDNIILAQAKSDARLAENKEQNRELEDKLAHEIRLKEKQIVDATEEAKEAERSDIGKELHDNINQLLSASRMYLEMAKKGGADSKMYLSRSSEYTLTAIDEIRKLTKGLTTDFIKNLGLCEAIEIIARDTMEINPVIISCTLESFNEDSVNDKFKLNVYRIVQENLSNVLKHAKATEVNISLLQNKRSILLSISDNGVGFDTGKRQKGIGIDNIKSRAVAFNGMAEFVSQPGHGCLLTVRFPLTDE